MQGHAHKDRYSVKNKNPTSTAIAGQPRTDKDSARSSIVTKTHEYCCQQQVVTQFGRC